MPWRQVACLWGVVAGSIYNFFVVRLSTWRPQFPSATRRENTRAVRLLSIDSVTMSERLAPRGGEPLGDVSGVFLTEARVQ